MKIMITGGKGQVGSECDKILNQDHEVAALGSNDLDVTDRSALKKTFKELQPDIILNCAAYTNVDGSESEREAAWDLNVNAPKYLAECVAKYGGRLIHISTDYVFDGKKKMPLFYGEDDQTNPISYYGQTKLKGEDVIKALTTKHTIVRTSWVYGIHGDNFLKTMLKLALQDPSKKYRVVNDQFGCPTWAYRLALQIAGLIEAKCQGTYHVTSEGYCTWYELAGFFLSKMGVPYVLEPCSTASYPTPAARPQNSILENQRLKKEKINFMKPWQDDVNQFVCNFHEQLINEAKEQTV